MMPNDAMVLMGLIFLSIFFAAMFGELTLSVAEVNCKDIVNEYKRLLEMGSFSRVVEGKAENQAEYEYSGMESGETQVEQTTEIETNATESSAIDNLFQWVGNIIQFPDIPGIFEKTVPDFIKNIRAKIYDSVFQYSYYHV